MTMEIGQNGTDGKLLSVDDSQLDGIAGEGEVIWRGDSWYAYCVCPDCGQKDYVADGYNAGVSFGMRHTCSNCGKQFDDYLRVPEKPSTEIGECRRP